MADSLASLGLSTAEQSLSPRPGIDFVGRGVTNPAHAMLNMLNEFYGGRGLSPKQMEQQQAMVAPLYRHAMEQHPEARGQPRERAAYGAVDKRSLAEDMNQAKVRYDIWLKNQTGQELTPQDRVTQGFVDFRNPNSLF
jgi:hypothetical protein